MKKTYSTIGMLFEAAVMNERITNQDAYTLDLSVKNREYSARIVCPEDYPPWELIRTIEPGTKIRVDENDLKRRTRKSNDLTYLPC